MAPEKKPRELSPAYQRRLIQELSQYVPRALLREAMNKARSHAGGVAPRGKKGEIVEEVQIFEEPEHIVPEEGPTTLGNLIQSRVHGAYTVLCDDLYGLGYLTEEERIAVGSAMGDLLGDFGDVLRKQRIMDRSIPGATAERIIISKRVRQAFSSIGGKAAIANKLIAKFPPHDTYVEAFAGGAAVYFRKDPVQREVLSELSEDVIFIFQGIQALTDQQIADLQSRNWVVDRDIFNQFREQWKVGQYASDLDHLYTLLYLRHAVFGSGDPSKSVDISAIGKTLTIATELPSIRDRMANTKIIRADARAVIKAFDNPTTFFYLDPPYPGGTSQRKDYAYGGEFTMEDLAGLCEQLTQIQGKFLMSLPAVVFDYIPTKANFSVEYIGTPVLQGTRRIASRELIIANFPLPQEAAAPVPEEAEADPQPTIVKAGSFEIIKSEKSKQLIWVVVMKPYFVDFEKQWSDEETILEACHRWMLKGTPVWREHEEDISDKVKVVQNYTLMADLKIDKDHVLPKGTWMAVFWAEDKKIWKDITSGKYRGGSVRGSAQGLDKSPPAGLETGRVPTLVSRDSS